MTDGLRADVVKDLFERQASTWSERYRPGGGLERRLRLLEREFFRSAAHGSAVLDVGCGTGDFARSAAKAGMRVTACDISGQMLSQATDRDAGHEVEWIQLGSSWDKLPFESSSFDAVMMSSVLEYVADVGTVMREVRRVLREDGLLFFTVPDMRRPIRWLEFAVRMLCGRRWPRAWCERSDRLALYLKYLDLSQQRHISKSWRVIVDHASMSVLETVDVRAAREALRLYVCAPLRREPDGG